jgi:hypothetical protein
MALVPPSRSAGAWLGVVVLLCTAAPVRAQEVTVGCWGAGGCDTIPDEPPLPCSTGVECASGLCLESTCLPPLDGCSYCFDGLPSYCPDLFLGDVPSPIRGTFDPILGTCSYAFCGGVAYVVRSGPPTISGLEDCLQMGGSWRLWGQGDCDSDGIPNALETGSGICSPDRVVGRARSTYVCADATFAMAGADPGVAPPCPSAVPPLVAPDVGACPVDDAGFEAFGICCETGADCPRLEGPWGVVRPVRCVQLRRGVGVCTYDGPTELADDASCVTHPPTATCLGGTSSVAFERWADGDCDAECEGTETRNLVAAEVCSCSPPTPDAGVDAHVEPDAYVERPDARAPELDAESPDGGAALDAASAPEGPPSFGGAGCRCAARTARVPGPLLAGVLLAFGVLSLSRRRIAKR